MIFTKKNQRIFICIGLVSLITAGVIYSFQGTNITEVKKSYDSIETGMTQQQVETLLGEPGDYRTHPRSWVRCRSESDGLKSHFWSYDGVQIRIDYVVSSTSSTVVEKALSESENNGPPVWVLFWDWLKNACSW